MTGRSIQPTGRSIHQSAQSAPPFPLLLSPSNQPTNHPLHPPTHPPHPTPQPPQVFVERLPNGALKTEPARREMTLLDLLTHTSGLSYGYGESVEERRPCGLLGREGGEDGRRKKERAAPRRVHAYVHGCMRLISAAP